MFCARVHVCMRAHAHTHPPARLCVWAADEWEAECTGHVLFVTPDPSNHFTCLCESDLSPLECHRIPVRQAALRGGPADSALLKPT